MRPADVVDPLVAGTIRIKQAQVAGWGPVGLRQLRTMLAREWTPPLPVYTWVLDLPDATILVDTGPRASTHWRCPRYHPYYPLAYRTRAGPDGGIDGALQAAGYEPGELDAVVMTHVHPDHTEGLVHLPDCPVYLEANEFRLARSLRGRFWGMHPSLIPEDDRTSIVSLDGGALGPFDRSHRLPWPGVSLVPTPGHTAHHCSIVVEGEGPPVVLAADACLRLDQLASRRADGVATRTAAASDTLERLDRWRRDDDVIVLPSHDRSGVDELLAAR